MALSQQQVADPLLRISNITKHFGGVTAVDDLSLDIAAGEFFALLGPSGCGKTTLLRMLAGFETPDLGRIALDSQDIAPVPPHLRPVNMMFQSYALFPHLSVRDNIAFGLKREGRPAPQIAARTAEMVALMKLDGMEDRRPDQLSGGQRQRVALARSLARGPRLLLLDEPLAALDKKLREQTQVELMALQRRLGMTFVIVTHDQEEAMTMADRIGVMDKGRLIQVATPRQLYEMPNSRFIAGFVGNINLFEGEARADDMRGTRIVTAEAGAWASATPLEPGAKRCVAVRPEKVKLTPRTAQPHANTVNVWAGRVTAAAFRGEAIAYRILLESGAELLALSPNAPRGDAVRFNIGDDVVASVAADDVIVLER